MSTDRTELIERARALVTEMDLGDGNSAGGVGAALRTVDGNIYTGVCIDLGSGLGFCAEVGAISQMVAHRETQIESIVAVTFDDQVGEHLVFPVFADAVAVVHLVSVQRSRTQAAAAAEVVALGADPPATTVPNRIVPKPSTGPVLEIRSCPSPREKVKTSSPSPSTIRSLPKPGR